MAEDGVAQGRLLLAVLCPGALNDIANFHIRRAGDLAALAVNAVLQRLVVQRAILQTQACRRPAPLVSGRDSAD